MKAQPFLYAQQDLADSKKADDGDDKIESFHQLSDSKRQAQLARDDVEPDGREDEADENRYQRFEWVAAAEPDETGKREKLNREDFRRAELESDLRKHRREERNQHDREQRAYKGGSERSGERLPALSLARHRVAVEGCRHRPRLAGDIEKYRRNGAAEKRAPVNRREKYDRRSRRHGECHGKQNGHPVGAAQSR